MLCQMHDRGDDRACTVQDPTPGVFDEVMVVAYKHRLQFFRMALLTPSYWCVRARGDPCCEPPKNM